MNRTKMELIEHAPFTLVVYTGNRGDQTPSTLPVPIARKDASWHIVGVRGRHRTTLMGGQPTDPAVWPERGRGEDSSSMPDMPAGRSIHECVEDGTMYISFCAMAKDGRSATPFDSRAVRLAPGEKLALKQGQYLGFGDSTIKSGDTIVVGPELVRSTSGDLVVEAVDETIGIVGWPTS